MKRTLILAGFALALVFTGIGCSSTSATGPGEKKLTLLKPMDQTLKRGELNKVAITVVRRNFTTDVPVRFENLPDGVKVVEKDKKIEEDQYIVNYTMFAANDADLVAGHVVKVTAEGPEGLKVTESFEVSVKE